MLQIQVAAIGKLASGGATSAYFDFVMNQMPLQVHL
jgi:hypothetical protein